MYNGNQMFQSINLDEILKEDKQLTLTTRTDHDEWFDDLAPDREVSSMGNRIYGVVRDLANGGAPVRGLRVQAWDEDWPDGNDFMGQSYTDDSGIYEIRYRPGHWDRGLGSLPIWNPDIYITVEIKNNRNKWVRIAKSRLYENHPLDRDLRIDIQLNLKDSESVDTQFNPLQHGFHFVNQFKVEPGILGVDLGPWKMGFCGGMCAGALHRFLYRIQIPKITSAPEDGTALHEELMQRQLLSMSPEMLPTMFEWQSAPDYRTRMRKTSIAIRTKDEWPKIKMELDDGRPVILVLIRTRGYFGNPTKNHQVLIYGYEFNPASLDLVLYTYDPAKPDHPQTLDLNLGLPEGKLFLKDSASRTTRGFFVNPAGKRATELKISN
jgi:hypothetical protein